MVEVPIYMYNIKYRAATRCFLAHRDLKLFQINELETWKKNSGYPAGCRLLNVYWAANTMSSTVSDALLSILYYYNTILKHVIRILYRRH